METALMETILTIVSVKVDTNSKMGPASVGVELYCTVFLKNNFTARISGLAN